MQDSLPLGESERPTTSFYQILVQTTPQFWVTPLLVGLNVVYFGFAVLGGVSPLEPQLSDIIRLGANFGPLTFQGEWWRLSSSNFVHIGIVHLAFNMWCLWSLGNLAERMFGNFTFLVIYLLSGIGGSLAGLLLHPEIVSAGASGAVFGIAGALLAFLFLGHISVPRPVVRELLSSLMFFVGFNLFFGAVAQGIDNAGHVGGLVVGTALGAILHRPLPRGHRSLVRFLSVPATCLLFLGLGRVAAVRGATDRDLMATQASYLVSAGQKDAAVEMLERAVASDPGFSDGYLALGREYMEANRLEDAVSALERASELSPKSAEAKTALGNAYLRSQRFDDATSAYRGAIDLDPELYEPQRHLGVSLAAAGRMDEAAKAFEVARKMEPRDIWVYLRSSQFLMEANRFDEAIAVLEDALTWDPSSADVLGELGLARLRNGDAAGAVEALDKAVSKVPKNPEYHNRLALAQAKAGEGDPSLESINIALELLPDAPHLLDSLGTVRFYRAELDEAVDAYRKALEHAPEQAVYHYNLSIALEKRGDSAEARRERDRALELDPSLSTVDAAASGEPII